MANRYIQKNKKGQWYIANQKDGKALRNANTQKEAIALAGAMKSTTNIWIKRSSGWHEATGWDKQIANLTKSKTTKKEESKKPSTRSKTTRKASVKKTSAAKKIVAAPKETSVEEKIVEVKEDKEVLLVQEDVQKLDTSSKDVQTETKEPNVKISEKKHLHPALAILVSLLIIGLVVGGAFLLGQYVIK